MQVTVLQNIFLLCHAVKSLKVRSSTPYGRGQCNEKGSEILNTYELQTKKNKNTEIIYHGCGDYIHRRAKKVRQKKSKEASPW